LNNFQSSKRNYINGKNGFTKVPKNLTRYRSENNFVGLKHKIIIKNLNVDDDNAVKSF